MILVRNLTRFRTPKSFLADARRLFLILKIPKNVEVSVVLAPPALMRQLNWQYRRKNKSTNVLSFGSSPRERKMILRSGRGMLGEIFISPSQLLLSKSWEGEPAIAKAEAREFGISFHQQLTRLLVHAILHLKGYTHARGEDARAMEHKERAIIKKLARRSIR